MKKRIPLIFAKNRFYFLKISLSILIGCIVAWQLKGILTPFLFMGKSIEGRNLFYQTGIVVTYTIFFALICFLIISFLEAIFLKPVKQLQQYFITWNKSLIANDKKRIVLALAVFCLGICSILLINNMLSHINTSNWQYENPNIIPVINPIGNDFRVGLYWPAENLVKSGFKSIRPDGAYTSNYPPLINLMAIPYLLLNPQKAYLVHVGLLIFTNIICLVLGSLMVRELILSSLGLEKMYVDLIMVFIFFAMTIYTFSSYSFAFSMERGNCDSFAMFFAMLAIWVLLKKPEKIWLQVILLSVAVHLKIYPAALFVLIFYKHGKKLFLPALLVNVIFLFALGPKMAFDFVKSATMIGTGMGVTWIGNHAAYSFAMSVEKTSANFLALNFSSLWGIFTLIPLVLWGVVVIMLILNKYSSKNTILLLMITVPLMDLLPTISHDYKSIILFPVIILLVALILKQIILRHCWLDYAQLGIVIVILLFISRPYTMHPDNPYALKESASYLINNKYLWSLALEIIMVWYVIENIIVERKKGVVPKAGQAVE